MVSLIRDDLYEAEHVEYDDETNNSELVEKYRALQEKVRSLEQIAEQQRATIDGLRENERRLRILAESTNDCVWEIDAEMQFTYVSPHVKDLLGYAPEEIEGRTPFDFMPAKEAKMAAEAFDEFMEKERLFTAYEHHKWHKNGHLVAVESSGVPIYEGNELVGVRGVDRDVSTRENACQQLQRAHKELTKRVEERTRELKEANELLSQEVDQRRKAQAELRRTSRRLNTLIEAIPDCLYFKDTEGRNVLVNKAYEEMFDISESEIVGKRDGEVVPDDLAEQCSESDARALEERRTVRTEEKCEIDGDMLWLETVKAPVVDENGEVKGLVGLSRDITETKKAEKALQRAEERYRKLVEHSIQGMAVFQGDPPEVLYANPGFSNLLGYTPDELQHFSPDEWQEIIHPEDRERILRRYRRRLSGEDVDSRTEFRLVAADGSVHWVRLQAARIQCAGEACVLATYVDITRWKQENSRLRRRSENLSRAYEKAGIGLAKIDEDLVVEELNQPLLSDTADWNEDEEVSCCDVLNRKGLSFECQSCPINRTLSDGVSHSMTELVTNDGTTCLIQLTSVPVGEDGQNAGEVLAVFQEVTGDGGVPEKNCD